MEKRASRRDELGSRWRDEEREPGSRSRERERESLSSRSRDEREIAGLEIKMRERESWRRDASNGERMRLRLLG